MVNVVHCCLAPRRDDDTEYYHLAQAFKVAKKSVSFFLNILFRSLFLNCSTEYVTTY
jgi:hypothetical protein